MPVFISHRTQDDELAQGVCRYLQNRRIICYIDDFDEDAEVARETDRITEIESLNNLNTVHIC